MKDCTFLMHYFVNNIHFQLPNIFLHIILVNDIRNNTFLNCLVIVYINSSNISFFVSPQQKSFNFSLEE